MEEVKEEGREGWRKEWREGGKKKINEDIPLGVILF